jgi:sugar phosphate isomerase/epimerase
MYSNASLSTMWAQGRFTTLNEFFAAAHALGFSTFELNHQVTSEMLSSADLSSCSFSGVHEPCPADISMPTMRSKDWLISSRDEDQRRLGVFFIKRSIDLAHKLDAPVVIIHCGMVLLDPSMEYQLRSLFEQGQTNADEYRHIKERLVKVRRENAASHLISVKKSLWELLDYAGRFGIILGLENRYHYFDIPLPDEMEILLGTANSQRLGFVYDVGHAQTLDRLGFFSFDEWLKKFSRRVIGAHLHDVIGIHDHAAPGEGEVDFEAVASYLPERAFRTLEMQGNTPPVQVRDSLQVLINHGCLLNNLSD